MPYFHMTAGPISTAKLSWFSTNIWLHRMLSTVRPPSVRHTAATVGCVVQR